MKKHFSLTALLCVTVLATGHSFADYNTGMKAYNKKEYVRALKEFKESSDKNSSYNLGVMYYKGEGVKPDHLEGLKWFHKAAELGNANAQFILGTIYDKGGDVPQDMAQAASWYRKAAGQGHVVAQFNLGLMLTNGEGVEKDRKEAVVWLKKAAKQGHQNAAKLLRVMGEDVPSAKKQSKSVTHSATSDI